MPSSPIYRNAINAIQVGVEDFNEGSPPRLASAIRNLTAGILLLCKEKLRRLSPVDEILIWKHLTPSLDTSGEVVFASKGKTTVDVQDIMLRFKSCGLELDSALLQKIADVRNRVEHHYVEDANQIRGAFADGLMFLSKFMPQHLGVDPQQEIDEEAWQSLVAEKEIEDLLRAECRASYAQMDWPPLLQEIIEREGCPECSSHLIRQTDPANTNAFAAKWSCRACGYSLDNQEWVGRVLPAYFATESFIAAKDGGDDPVDTCPECEEEAYLHAEAMCLACGFELEANKCLVCATPLGLDDYGETICGYHRYVADKERDR